MSLGVSIRQIAALAGVSRGTVDRALNNRPGIAPGQREKILVIAREHGYRINRAGRVLGLNKSPLKIGIQMPSDGNDFFIDVLAGIRQAADELADYGLSVAVRTMKGYSEEMQIRQVRELAADGVNGLAVVPIDRPGVRLLFNELAGRSLPVIAFNTDITDSKRLCYIGNDYQHSGRIAAGVLGLASNGAALATLVITGSTQVLGHNQRIAGFHAAIRASYPNIQVIDIEENQDDDETSCRLVEKFIAKGKRFQALYLTAGGVAGACRALEAHGLGGVVKVICFDQVRSTIPYHRSGLITASIGQDPFQQGYQAVRRLFDYLLDGSAPPGRILTKNTIIIREHYPEAQFSGPGGGQPHINKINQEANNDYILPGYQQNPL